MKNIKKALTINEEEKYSHSPNAHSAKDSQADGEQCPQPHVVVELLFGLYGGKHTPPPPLTYKAQWSLVK